MSTTMLRRLIEEQNTTWQRMQDIQRAAETEDRDMSAEERTNWDAAEARLTEVSGDIERLNRMAALERPAEDPILTGRDEGQEGREGEEDARYREAFNLYLRGGMDRLNGEQRQMMMARDLRAQGTGSDPAGGFLVPDEYRNTLVETMMAFGGLLNIAEVITTSTGADLAWPTNDDTGNEGEFLGEGQPVPELDVALGGRKLKSFTLTSKLTRVALTLLQDSAFNLESWLPEVQGRRIGRRAARAFITGTGVDQPQGLATGAVVGKTGASGQTTSIIYDDLIDLEHSVNSAYRGTNARYLLGDASLKIIRKLKDGDQRPLWVPIPVPGFPATINGYPYTLDDSMPAPAANAKSVAFGDFRRGYLIRKVLDVQNVRLTERYAEYLQVGFMAFVRLDGMINDPAAVRAYKHAAS